MAVHHGWWWWWYPLVPILVPSFMGPQVEKSSIWKWSIGAVGWSCLWCHAAHFSSLSFIHSISKWLMPLDNVCLHLTWSAARVSNLQGGMDRSWDTSWTYPSIFSSVPQGSGIPIEDHMGESVGIHANNIASPAEFSVGLHWCNTHCDYITIQRQMMLIQFGCWSPHQGSVIRDVTAEVTEWLLILQGCFISCYNMWGISMEEWGLHCESFWYADC